MDRIRLTGPAATNYLDLIVYQFDPRNCDADPLTLVSITSKWSGKPRFVRTVDWQRDSREAKHFLIFGRWQILKASREAHRYAPGRADSVSGEKAAEVNHLQNVGKVLSVELESHIHAF